MSKSNKNILIAVPFVAVLLIGAYFIVIRKTGDTSDSQSSSSVTKTTYKNGSYEASNTYQVPRSSNSIKATIVIDNDTITKVTTEHTTASSRSKEYTDSFDKEVSDAVVGKKLGSAKLSILAGASLTSEAFNKILDSVIEKAK